eukprot:COSAG04_NODE_9138_length_894_cov_1.426415_2_plen_80_part_01
MNKGAWRTGEAVRVERFLDRGDGRRLVLGGRRGVERLHGIGAERLPKIIQGRRDACHRGAQGLSLHGGDDGQGLLGRRGA